MEYNEIDKNSSWGSQANNVNTNFQKTDVEIEKLWNKADEQINNKGIFGSDTSLSSLYLASSNKKGFFAFVGSKDPFRKWEVQIDGGEWINTGQDINIADIDLKDYAKTDEGIVVRTEDGTIPDVDLSDYVQYEDIRQDVDSTQDKPISPNGVLAFLENMHGVSKNEKSEVTLGANIFNPNNIKNGYFKGYQDQDVESGQNSYTELMAVEPDTEYLVNNKQGGNAFLFYNKDKAVVLSTGGNVSSIITPSNGYYIRFNLDNRIDTGYYLRKLSKIESVNNIGVFIELKDIIKATKSSFTPIGSNLMADTSWIYMWFSGGTNSLGSGGGDSWHSDYVEVKPKTYYTTNIELWAYSVLFYDEEKNYIDFIGTYKQNSYDGKTFTTPLNCHYIRCNTQYKDKTVIFLYENESGSSEYYSLPNLVVPERNIITSGSSSSNKDEIYGLGDSITRGNGIANPYAKIVGDKLRVNYVNLGRDYQMITGAETDESGLACRVDLLPENFTGLITVMIGVNDARTNQPLGDFDTVKYIGFSNLNPANSVAEALRYNIIKIQNRCPQASLMFILPLHAWEGDAFTKLENYRNLIQKTCSYMAIPCSELYKDCRIAPFTYSLYMWDGSLHPNADGHKLIADCLYAEILNRFSYRFSAIR